MVTDGAHAVADQPRVPSLAGPATAPMQFYRCLPLAARTRFGLLFPSWVRPINAVFWTASLAEVVPAVFGSAGITAEQPQIFISYRQMESAALAIQLFDALGHAGFDVFLDPLPDPSRSELPGPADRATRRQVDGLVLGIRHVPGVRLGSPTEVNVAKTCGLGLQALNLCQAPAIPGLDDGSRMKLGAPDFVGGSFGPTATAHHRQAAGGRSPDPTGARPGDRKASSHAPGFVGGCRAPRRRKPGADRPRRDPDRLGRRTEALRGDPDSEARRDLPDFHRVHGQAVKPTIGVVIGLSRLMESTRHRRLTWLAGVSTLTFRDEGDMLALAHEMVRGTL